MGLGLRLNLGGVSADFFEKLSLLKRMEDVIKVKSNTFNSEKIVAEASANVEQSC